MGIVYHLLDESESFSEHHGGAVSRWAANVLRDGSEVVVCPSFDSSWGFPEEKIYKLPYWSLTGPVHPLLYRMPWTLQKKTYTRVFRALLKKLKPGDVVYTHNRPEAASVLATLAERHGFHLVLHMHNSHLILANRGQLAALKRVPIVFCSEFLRKELNEALPGHFETTHVVYNGADDKKFSAVERTRTSTPTIIFTGRLVAYKGAHVLMEAMKILEKRKVSATCKIVGGSGFGKSRPTSYTRKLQRIKPSNTEMLGYMSGDLLAERLRNADIFACPSIWNDPFPLAPLEAMATGLPVVASSTGGLREALAHGGGVLVSPNDPEALATALEQLVVDASYREQLGRDARTAFENNFLWSSVRNQYQKVLDALPV